VHESIILVLPPPTCNACTIAVRLHVHCAIYDAPPTPPVCAIHHTILVTAISCKGQPVPPPQGGAGAPHLYSHAPPPPVLHFATSCASATRGGRFPNLYSHAPPPPVLHLAGERPPVPQPQGGAGAPTCIHTLPPHRYCSSQVSPPPTCIFFLVVRVCVPVSGVFSLSVCPVCV